MFVGYIKKIYINYYLLIFILYKIYGQIIGNLFELRLFLYLVYFLVVVISPLGMNIATYGVLIVERLINIFGIRAYLYSNIY